MAAVGGTIVRARRLAPLLAAAALLAPVLAGSACFKPNITDGGFKCAEGGICPEGFKCDQGGSCVKHLPDGGLGGKGGAGGKAGGGGAGGEIMPSCFDATPGCEPPDGGTDANLCDPLCQTGCGGCQEKCSVNTNSVLTCNQVTSTRLKKVLEGCIISSGGSGAQSDDCEPGLVCLDEECGARCYQFCRSDQDCTNAGCDRAVGSSGQKVCDVPFKDCVPLGGSANTGCGGGLTTACYLSSTHSDHTVCDCPFKDGRPNAECQRSRDCNAGLACTWTSAQQRSICLQVCKLSDNGADCPGVGSVCRQYKGASGNEASHPVYGVCF